jgi:hypothetical protein
MYGFGYIQPSIQAGSTDILSGAVGSGDLAPNVVNSGNVSSGAIMGAAGGGPFNIASGTLTWNDLGSGAIRSGHIASGQVGFRHLSFNAVNSGNIAAQQVASGHMDPEFISNLGGGSVGSGAVLSGAVTGAGGGGFLCIASGTISTNDIGNASIVSGHYASGSISPYANPGGRGRVASDTTVSGTALTSGVLTGCTLGLATNTRYAIKGVFFVDFDSTGGFNFDLAGGTVTASGFTATFIALIEGVTGAFGPVVRTSGLAGAVGGNPLVGTTATVYLDGLIYTNAAGTLIPRFAQNSANNSSVVKANSYLRADQVP